MTSVDSQFTYTFSTISQHLAESGVALIDDHDLSTVACDNLGLGNSADEETDA